MLNDATAIKAIDIHQSTRLRLSLNSQMHNTQIVTEILPQHGEISEGEDLAEEGGVGVTALWAEWVVLD